MFLLGTKATVGNFFMLYKSAFWYPNSVYWMYLFCYSRILQLNEILDTRDKQHHNLLLWIKQIYNSHHGRLRDGYKNKHFNHFLIFVKTLINSFHLRMSTKYQLPGHILPWTHLLLWHMAERMMLYFPQCMRWRSLLSEFKYILQVWTVRTFKPKVFKPRWLKETKY